MAAHRYWRLYIGAGNVSTSVVIGELILATTSGGASVATGGTATASSTNSTDTASKAFDGTQSNANYWRSTIGGTNVISEWIQYDFGSGNDKDIAEMRIYFPASGGTPTVTMAPSDFTLYYSDNGIKWVRQKSWSLNVFSFGETKTFDTTPTPDASITNRIAYQKNYRYNSAAQSQSAINNSASKFAPYFFGAGKFIVPNRRTPYSGPKRIAGSTTVLGNPAIRVVHLLEQKSALIIGTFNTKADGVFQFSQIAAGTYTVLGVNPSGEQNSIVYAHVTAVD